MRILCAVHGTTTGRKGPCDQERFGQAFGKHAGSFTVVSPCSLPWMIGTFFIIPAGEGVLRMPYLYMRLSAAAKASTFGTSFLLLAVAVFHVNGWCVTATHFPSGLK